MTALRALSWDHDGADWPNRTASRFVEAGGLRWHVQRTGSGPPILLLHGTGASTHSFRDLLPLLATHHEVLAPDLPGHGFSSRPEDPEAMSLPGLALALSAMLAQQNFKPALAVGHSAGAALLLRLAIDGVITPRGIVSLNGAVLPQPGFRHPLFSAFVRGIVSSDTVARWFAGRIAEPGGFERLMGATGSDLDARGAALYRRLSSAPAQVGAALAMMARWDLRPIERDMAKLAPPLLLVTAARDRMILPGESVKVRARLPSADIEQLIDAGHLAHEEHPARIAALIAAFARRPEVGLFQDDGRHGMVDSR
jgi:magnesium chelatase accessory protein